MDIIIAENIDIMHRQNIVVYHFFTWLLLCYPFLNVYVLLPSFENKGL
jgi:hypothetical protein